MASENRLIDADKFGMHLADVQLANRGWKDDLCDFLDDVMDALDEHPTVDAVEVVRCKDCTEWGGVPFGNVCRRWSAPLAGMKNCTGPDDYCSYGKRRIDNEVHSSDPCHL